MKRYGIWIGVLVGAAFVMWLLTCFVFSSYLILSPDMKDALLPGERVVVNKWSYGLRLPCMRWLGYFRIAASEVRKGDIVVFNNPLDVCEPVIDCRKPLIYRCLAGPGDTIAIDSCHFIVPKEGVSVEVTQSNCTLLCNTLRLHERRNASVRQNMLYIDGELVKWCMFTKDYYWMISDKMPNVTDSHLFGLVPSDHIIGRAVRVWFSKDTNQDLMHGYRWNRFFNVIR
jgi:signal peptidase I